MTTGYAGRTGRAGRAAGLAAAFAGLAIGLWAAVGPPRTAHAQPPGGAYPRPTADDKKRLSLIGAAECKACHSEDDPASKELYQQTKGFEFVRLWENKVWSAHDLHSTAYRSLLTDRTVKNKKDAPNATAQRMEDRLRKYKGETYTVAGDVACLACHASVRQPADLLPPAAWKAASFSTADGVGCEMCHGHGSLYQNRHRDSREVDAKDGEASRVVDWRDAAPGTKREWGLTDLRDPAVAAATCASCHIGNKDEGRFVTHDMYAAGHPPLPPMDLLAYSREQPRHWGLPAEMPYLTKLAASNPAKAFEVFHVRAGESHVARRFAEAALATLGATATLGEQLADDAKKKNDGLDFAAFDCYSCHHDLKYPSERQDRGYVGRPGRPLYRPAAFALARLVLDHASGMDKGEGLKGAPAELDKLELELADAFTVKTYGDPDKVRAATAKLAKWTAEARKKLEPVRYTPAEVTKLFNKVVAAGADPKRPVGDPEVAQLYTWAVETLYLDLYKPVNKKEPPAELVKLTKNLEGSVVARLRPKTAFYYEQQASGPLPGQTNGRDDSVDHRLKERMDTFNSFRGAPFRKAFMELKAPK